MGVTQWCTISGGPSSGKTTLIVELQKLGYDIIEEVPRKVIEEEKKRGIQRGNKEHDMFIQLRIFDERIKIANTLARDKLYFFDTDFITSIPYAKRIGVDCAGIYEYAKKFKPRIIFHLEQLPFVDDDGVRIENLKLAQELNKEIKKEYEKLGYSYFILPPVSVKERLDFILNKIR